MVLARSIIRTSKELITESTRRGPIWQDLALAEEKSTKGEEMVRIDAMQQFN